MGLLDVMRDRVLPWWKCFVIVLTPLILLPLPIINTGMEARTGYVVILMAVYWMTKALPLPVTSLLPIVLFPLLGVMDSAAVCFSYMKEASMMFVGSMILATSIEYCNLHRRVALGVLLIVGGSPRWLLLGFITISAGLSMWISNVATLVMIVPIVEAVFDQLSKDEENLEEDKAIDPICTSTSCATLMTDGDSSTSPDCVDKSVQQLNLNHVDSEKRKEEWNNVRKCVLLSVAYSVNLGGTGTLIGTAGSVILIGLLTDLYGSGTGLNFSSWLAFSFPGLIINLFLTWIWLQFLYIGFKRNENYDKNKEAAVKKIIRRKYDELGPITFHEVSVIVLFTVCIFLWFFRNPQFISGWGGLFAKKVGDSTVVLAIGILFFILPAKNPFVRSSSSERNCGRSTLISWKYVQEKFPWGLLFLLGGGFALSDASKVSGLSKWLGNQMTGLQMFPPFFVMLIVSIMIAGVTEIASNPATANIFLPILIDLAVSIQINPIYLTLPAAIASSYAFMLPAGCIPCAIVLEVSKMKPIEMAKAGIVMNLMCISVVCLMTASYGSWLLGLDQFPTWAMTNSTNAKPP